MMSTSAETARRSGGRLAALRQWIDDRFPMTKMWKEHAAEYYAPKNFNFWYYFGSLALVVLVLQIVTGIFLTMNYKPSAADAFSSVEYIMRDVEWGWLIRYLHSTGQLHKGGPNSGVFVLITATPVTDVAIPGQPFSFATLELAQGLGDFNSLDATARRALHIHLPSPDARLLEQTLQQLAEHAPRV